jgi:hypothetical protein
MDIPSTLDSSTSSGPLMTMVSIIIPLECGKKIRYTIPLECGKKIQYTVLHNREEINASVTKANVVNASVTKANVVDAMDDARHEFVNNKAHRESQHILLQFPPGHVLSSKAIYEDARENEELDYDHCEVEIKHEKLAGVGIENWIHYQVARTDLRVSKRGKVEKKEKLSKMAAKIKSKMEGMKTE